MSTTAPSDVEAILDRIRDWPSPTRIALARRILETLEASPSADPPSPDRPLRGVSAARAAGLLRTDRPPPTVEECRRIIEEEVWRKYGS